MDPQFVPESIAYQLAQIWAVHRTPAFVYYLLETFGCEPLKPVEFAGIFSLQMTGGYFFPDLPAGPGLIIGRLWLMDDTGFRPSSLNELRPVENLESDNPLVVYDPSSASYQPIRSQPCLHVYPRLTLVPRLRLGTHCPRGSASRRDATKTGHRLSGTETWLGV
jgi:hypothetical protein